MKRLATPGALAVVIFLVVAAPRGAGALTPAEWAVRRQLIAAAEAAHDNGAHTKALSFAQKASALETTPSLRFFIAREEEETGALADGYATAQECALEAEHDPKLHNRDEIVKNCREIESRLKGRVGYLVVDVKDRPTGLHVKLAGQDLNEAALGIPYVITPGTVVVEATAPGHSPYRLEIEVAEGKTVNVSVTLAPQSGAGSEAGTCPPGQRLGPGNICVADSCQVGMIRTADLLHCCWPGQTWQPELDRCAGTAQCPNGTRQDGTSCAAEVSEPASRVEVLAPRFNQDQQQRRLRPSYGLALAAVGVATLVGSAVVWLISDSDFNSAKQSCNSLPGCSLNDYNNDVSTVQHLDRVAAAGFIVGGVFTVSGALFYWWSERHEAAPPPQRTGIAVNPTGHSMALYWRF